MMFLCVTSRGFWVEVSLAAAASTSPRAERRLLKWSRAKCGHRAKGKSPESLATLAVADFRWSTVELRASDCTGGQIDTYLTWLDFISMQRPQVPPRSIS